MDDAAAGQLAGVIARNAAGLMALPGVIGVAEGEQDGSPCVRVFVARDAAELPPVPAVIEGYRVIVERVERFSALGPEQE